MNWFDEISYSISAFLFRLQCLGNLLVTRRMHECLVAIGAFFLRPVFRYFIIHEKRTNRA